MARGKGIDIDGIREEVRVALADPSGEKWTELQKKYPYMGEQATKKAAEGGIMRLGYDNGGEAGMVEDTLNKINQRALATARAAKEAGIPLTEAQEQMIQQAEEQGLAYGGRIGYDMGGLGVSEEQIMAAIAKKFPNLNADEYTLDDLITMLQVSGTMSTEGADILDKAAGLDMITPESVGTSAQAVSRHRDYIAQGGRVGAQEGGLMNLGGMEKDYRQEGGFVPIGGQERADDVPARLSKNEFVFTADAVRAAGGGDIDAGAEVMENLMNNLEQGGQVSEESQGLEGARDMFATSQRLEGVM